MPTASRFRASPAYGASPHSPEGSVSANRRPAASPDQEFYAELVQVETESFACRSQVVAADEVACRQPARDSWEIGDDELIGEGRRNGDVL
jgi:hypothetical protein